MSGAHRFRNIIFLVMVMGLLIFSTSCGQNEDYKAPQLIKLWKIEPERTSSLDLERILFSDQYDLSFSTNENLEVNYNSDSRDISVTPNDDFYGLTFLEFQNNGRELLLPVLVEKKIDVTFNYTPDTSVTNVYLMGNFNTWKRNDIPMTDPDQDGTYSTTIKMNTGVYKYQFVVDQTEIWDPENPDKIPNGFGSFNSIVRVKDPDKSKIPNVYFQDKSNKKVRVKIDAEKFDDKFKLYVLNNNQFLSPDCFERNQDELVIDLAKLDSDNKILRVIPTYDNLPGNIIKVWVQGNKIIDNDEFVWQDAIIYSLMVDRFANGNQANDDPVQHPELADQANFQGGDLDGLIQKIQEGYFDKLGINTIWVSPVNMTTDKAFQEWPEPHRYFTGYHGYWPVSFKEVEPRFGNLQKFKKLVDTAHKHDIKILLDFVSNHVHQENPWFQENRDWFGTYELPDGEKNIRKWNEYRLTTWFDTFLPSFDYLHSQEALDTVTQSALWWLEQTGIDGFRHDATKHIPDKFWKTLTSRIKTGVDPQRKDRVFQIGETFGSYEFIKSYVNNGMLDSQFNFELFFTLRRIFIEENSDFRDLEISLDKSLSIYGYNNLMGNIMDSHDQVRIMAYLDGDLDLADNGTERAWEEPKIEVDKASSYQKQRTIFTFLMTIPGVPIVYYGDEVGITGANDPDNRRLMQFQNELD